MVKIEELSRDEQKILCEALKMASENEPIPEEMLNQLSKKGQDFLEESLINSLSDEVRRELNI